MQKLLLLGDEAIAQAFIDAGGSAINSYPGTPSTQITEYVIKSKDAKEKGVVANWCANEKTALEASIGVAYAGKRAMTCMKHVGLNVCGDPFMNAAIIGTTKAPATAAPATTESALILYYNADGGKYYHAIPNCPAVDESYWPLDKFYYSDLNTTKFKNLLRCPKCNPVERLK